jgi:hypothetical protein
MRRTEMLSEVKKMRFDDAFEALFQFQIKPCLI